MIGELNLETDPRFPLDKRRLDDQWEEQPGLFMEYALALENALADVDALKADMDRTAAKMNIRVRDRFTREGIKVTESLVNATVIQEESYLNAHAALQDAQEQASRLKVMVQALNQRKSALESLVRLHGQEYFAVPVAAPGDRVAHSTRTANTHVRHGMKRGR